MKVVITLMLTKSDLIEKHTGHSIQHREVTTDISGLENLTEDDVEFYTKEINHFLVKLKQTATS